MRLHFPRATVVMAVAATLAFAGVAAPTGGQNDAGSGADAAAALANAYALPGLGTYFGNLTQGDDGDDFTWQPLTAIQEPTCVTYTYTAGSGMRGHLAAVTPATPAGVTELEFPMSASKAGIASKGLKGFVVSVAPETGATPGDYSFALSTITTLTMPLGDAGSGQDAGATTTTALTTSAACVGGRLNPTLGDSVDTYKFTGLAASRLSITSADTAGTLSLTLLDANGQFLASALSGQILSHVIPGGTVYLQASSSNSTNYVFGNCEPNCGEPPASCRPACTEIWL